MIVITYIYAISSFRPVHKQDRLYIGLTEYFTLSNSLEIN